jgi:hypothetical protein
MATATRIPADVPAPPPARIELDLSIEEAEVLAFLFRSIGGPTSGPRGDVDRIANALRSVGVSGYSGFGRSIDIETYDDGMAHANSIYIRASS